MLRELRVMRFAVIEEVTVPFAPGLNVLTGETGAGKSILIDALLLLLGARAHPDVIRSDSDSATVEAVFDVDPGGEISSVLGEAGHSAEDGQLIVRRELSRGGRSRAFVNDTPATVGLLERLGDRLVEIHGQHEHQLLMEPARPLELLDRFAGAEAGRDDVAALVGRWEAARQELERLRTAERDRAQKEDLYRFQLSEIDGARLTAGEEEDLRLERQRLQHAERLTQGLAEVTRLLYDDTESAMARVARASRMLGELAKLDPALAAAGEPLESAQAHLEEAVEQARRLRDRLVFEPGRLEEIDARLDALTKLKRKYGESVEAILRYREQVAADLERLDRHDELVAEQEAAFASLATEAGRAALVLSAAREKAAGRLEGLIQRELRALGMEKAQFRVVLTREPAVPGGLSAGPDNSRVTPRGLEAAQFLLSTNPGEELKPLSRVISGGELSRTMLGIKVILAAADRVPTLVFDEVDAGIGGRIAEVVGQKLRQTARSRQVLCVTHLAQIAAYADQHVLVTKTVTGKRTRTTVEPLSADARVGELARMLGGERLTETALKHARELYRGARASG
ncbi:MAG: DNA repair protein RecN [Candidatus Rokubacteria bacterium]|nr:DNA repair protein RecN [Candidatus Rokubacteria bacterium]